MNPQQMKYARERINQIYNEKVSKTNGAYQQRRLSPLEALEALKNGRYKIRDTYDTRQFAPSIRDFITFNDEEETENNNTLLTQKLSELKKAKSTVLDELMLGDSERAIEALKKFEDS